MADNLNKAGFEECADVNILIIALRMALTIKLRFTMQSPKADVLIPPGRNVVENVQAAALLNYSELGVQRYKKIFGDSLYARDMKRQKQEAKLACGTLNKGLPPSYRSA